MLLQMIDLHRYYQVLLNVFKVFIDNLHLLIVFSALRRRIRFDEEACKCAGAWCGVQGKGLC